MNRDAVPKIAPELRSEFVDDNVVVVSVNNGHVRVFNGIGTIVWKMLVAGTSPHAIQEHLVIHYDAPPEQAQQDVESFLNELTERGLLIW